MGSEGGDSNNIIGEVQMGRLKDLLLQENLDLTTITTSKAEARRLWHHLNPSQLSSVAEDKV